MLVLSLRRLSRDRSLESFRTVLIPLHTLTSFPTIMLAGKRKGIGGEGAGGNHDGDVKVEFRRTAREQGSMGIL